MKECIDMVFNRVMFVILHLQDFEDRLSLDENGAQIYPNDVAKKVADVRAALKKKGL
jgi:hypothetical protein